MMNVKLWKYLVSTCLLCCSIASFAATSPADMLQQVTNQMLTALEKTENRNTQSIYRLVQTILLPHVDLNKMSQLVVGKYWSEATPMQQKEFEQQFTYFVTRTYSTALSSYSNQKVRFFPVRGGMSGSRVQVSSVIQQSNGQNIAVNYRMQLENGNWKVYDFSVEGVSLVENYRSQFADTLRTKGLAGLNQQLKSHNSRTK